MELTVMIHVLHLSGLNDTEVKTHTEVSNDNAHSI